MISQYRIIGIYVNVVYLQFHGKCFASVCMVYAKGTFTSLFCSHDYAVIHTSVYHVFGMYVKIAKFTGNSMQ